MTATTTRPKPAELRAMQTLAERYNKQFEKLLAAELEHEPTGRLERQAAEEQTGPVYDLDGELIADTAGVAVTRGVKVQLKDGAFGEVVRIDRRTRRAVVRRDDDGRLVAAVAHGTTIVPAKRRPGRPRKQT